MFYIVLPFVLSLYSDSKTRVYALVLFEQLSIRLGSNGSKEYLLKPLLQLFDVIFILIFLIYNFIINIYL